jgi:cytochrome c-type biogenesis protein CcmH/NrfG
VSRDAAALRDEVELLVRSLEDARAEHARGELDDASLAAIERRDGARLADARAALGAIATSAAPTAGAPASSAHPRRRARWLLGVAAACLALAVGVVAVAAADPFTRSPSVPAATTAGKVKDLLTVAEVLVGTKHPLRAITAFDAVLRLAPRNAEALVESGWLRYEDLGLGDHRAAQVALGAAALRRAVRLAPNDAAAHLYWAVVLYQHDHNTSAARTQAMRALSLPGSAADKAIAYALLAHLG